MLHVSRIPLLIQNSESSTANTIIPGGRVYIVKNVRENAMNILSLGASLLTQRKVYYGQLYQMQQIAPEEQVMLAYLDQLTS